MKEMKELEKTLIWSMNYYGRTYRDISNSKTKLIKVAVAKERIKDLFKQYKEANK